ncbi:hypothetical protein OUZ56_031349 [Daphnia magna]|uniref:Uncharacterized protein n=1 Tax=Daphnia magna TaxID=35525 RepID=A0ABQ9ZTZ3_9CRUS|nr:hypothetical protein OUZ56_031349 [Daphnia magna]
MVRKLHSYRNMRYVEVSEGQHNRRLRNITERTAAFWNVNSAPFGAYGNTQNPSSAYFTTLSTHAIIELASQTVGPAPFRGNLYQMGNVKSQ